MPLIVLEGIDGCGKTTQVRLLVERLQALGRTVRPLREPGGTALGERQRALLLDVATKACAEAELFGYLQARAQLVHEVIRPALAAGETVILDRFYHSTIAYQAYGLGLDREGVRGAITLATGGLVPDGVAWLDLDPDECLRRRAAGRGPEDRIEARGPAYLRRVHAGFAALAAAGELKRVDADGAEAVVAERIRRAIGC